MTLDDRPGEPVAEGILAQAGRVRLLSLDVDGVLTDGRLYYGPDGTELKAFHAQDGSAMKRLMAAGVPIAIVTGRTSQAVRRRAAELDVPYLYTGVDDKLAALRDIAARSGVEVKHMAHAGDDHADLVLVDHVGMFFSVPDAHPAAIQRANYVTSTPGGRGAVREICDLVVAARG